MNNRRKASIEEVISHRLVWVGLAVLILTALLTILLFRSGYNRQVKEDMSITAQVIAAALEDVTNLQQDTYPLIRYDNPFFSSRKCFVFTSISKQMLFIV